MFKGGRKGLVGLDIGSHAVKLDPKDTPAEWAEKLSNRSHLWRFRLKNVGDDPKKIEIDSEIELDVSDALKQAGFYDPDPARNNAKIEGLTARTGADRKKELILALREPHDFMLVYSAQLPETLKTGEKLALKPLFSFAAGAIGTHPFQLSSIEYVPQWNGFFMLTSTEDAVSNAFFGNALWFVSDAEVKSSVPSRPIKPQILWLFAVDMKAEGLCVLPNPTNEKLRLAIVFDNDFDDTTKPGRMQLIEVAKQ